MNCIKIAKILSNIFVNNIQLTFTRNVYPVFTLAVTLRLFFFNPGYLNLHCQQWITGHELV